nr:papain-like cysteine protease family protein [Streptomyces alkaliterrae]
MSRTASARGRLALVAAAAAVLVAAPAAPSAAAASTASTASTPAASTPVLAASAATADSPPTTAAWRRLNITMQAQQYSNWCWAAAGNTIAAYFGRSHNQNAFCNAAFNRAQGTSCPNNQATLGHVQNGLSWAGIRPGSYVNGWLRYDTVQSEINGNRPIETRIGWRSGGGHMHVIYGYDTASSLVYWGDPWPSSDRYNWASHSWYVNNNSFAWTHSLYRIGA